MVTKKVEPPEPEETPVPTDVCDGCVALRSEFEQFVAEVRDKAQGM